jgi:hypothetical protein
MHVNKSIHEYIYIYFIYAINFIHEHYFICEQSNSFCIKVFYSWQNSSKNLGILGGQI